MSHPMMRILSQGTLRTKENSSLKNVSRSFSLLALIRLSREMIIVLGLPLNLATIILGCIFSILLSDFRAKGLRNIPISSTAALTHFLHANAEINVHLLPGSCYFISSSRRWILCSCTHTISTLCSSACAVSSGNWSVQSNVLTLNVAICIVLLHLKNYICVRVL